MNDIGWAVKQMQNGARVARSGWNGKGMFLMFIPGFTVQPAPGTDWAEHGFVKVDVEPRIDMFTAQRTIQPGWLCSQADLLAIDWEIAA